MLHRPSPPDQERRGACDATRNPTNQLEAYSTAVLEGEAEAKLTFMSVTTPLVHENPICLGDHASWGMPALVQGLMRGPHKGVSTRRSLQDALWWGPNMR